MIKRRIIKNIKKNRVLIFENWLKEVDRSVLNNIAARSLRKHFSILFSFITVLLLEKQSLLMFISFFISGIVVIAAAKSVHYYQNRKNFLFAESGDSVDFLRNIDDIIDGDLLEERYNEFVKHALYNNIIRPMIQFRYDVKTKTVIGIDFATVNFFLDSIIPEIEAFYIAYNYSTKDIIEIRTTDNLKTDIENMKYSKEDVAISIIGIPSLIEDEMFYKHFKDAI